MINKISLTEAIRALGRAMVYAGDAFTVGGLVALGATEGDIEVEEQEEYSDLTLPEYTGGAVHDRKVLQSGALVTIPLIVGPAVGGGSNGGAVYDKISSIGDGGGGGYSTQQPVVTTNLLIVPESEIGAGLSYPLAGPWSPAAPVHAIWIWRAVPEVSSQPFRHGDGGKIIREVPFRSMFDTTKPEGHKLWTRGDPIPAGIEVRI